MSYLIQQDTNSGRQFGYQRLRIDSKIELTQGFLESYSKVFTDQDITIEATRPQLKSMISTLRKNDVVVVESLDNLGYCFSDLQATISSILNAGCSVKIQNESLVFSPKHTSCNNSILQLLNAIARVEKEMHSGLLLLQSKSHNKQSREHTHNPRSAVPSLEEARLRKMHKSGVPTCALQEEFNLTRGAVCRILHTKS